MLRRPIAGGVIGGHEVIIRRFTHGRVHKLEVIGDP